MKREPLTHLPKHFAALVLGLDRTLYPYPALCGSRRREWIVYSLEQATCPRCRAKLRTELMVAREALTLVIADSWRYQSFARLGERLVPVRIEPLSPHGVDIFRDHRPPPLQPPSRKKPKRQKETRR